MNRSRPKAKPRRQLRAAEETPRSKHTIGALLRETRENYGGDIERIAAALRIRPVYLTALEEGRYDRLPAPVYALGFVRAYAIHMGLDGEEAVRRFKQEANGLEISRNLVFPIPLADHSIPRKPILIVGAGAADRRLCHLVLLLLRRKPPARTGERGAGRADGEPSGSGANPPAPTISPPEASAAMTVAPTSPYSRRRRRPRRRLRRPSRAGARPRRPHRRPRP